MASSARFLAPKFPFNPFLAPALPFVYLIAFIILLIAESPRMEGLTMSVNFIKLFLNVKEYFNKDGCERL